VLHIEQAVLYPVRKEYGVLDSYSYGFVFYIYLDDLAKLLKSLSEKDDSYHNVQGIRVSNGMLRSYDDPPLLVEMILARATYDPEAQVAPKPLTRRDRRMSGSGSRGLRTRTKTKTTCGIGRCTSSRGI